MAKHIVICSDGTGNSTVKGRGTNVFKLFECVDLNGHRTDPSLTTQIAVYDDGVGTERFKPLKVFAGITGYGLSRNVRQLYKELCRVYDPGDRIFLFGFSRGAFTVRALAGLIASCGILDAARLPSAAALEAGVCAAYRAYRQRYRTALGRVLRGPGRAAAEAFRRAHALGGSVRIAFLGVWDTVDAVGLPLHLSDVVNTAIYRFKFPERTLHPAVERACHALAIDDERHSFWPLLWDEAGAGGRIEQVWFAGAHSNVGGGYPKQGLSLVALDWMMAKAEAAGLRFVASGRRFCRDHANAADKLYDPRAGLGALYRWKPRDIAALCRASGARPAVHLSVLERIAHGTEDYAPGNLAPDAAVVITPSGDPRQDAAAAACAREAETALRAAHADGRPLLARVRALTTVGRFACYVHALSWLLLLVATGAAQGADSPWPLLRNVATLAESAAAAPLGAAAAILAALHAQPGPVLALAAGVLASQAAIAVSRRRRALVFSQFWHRIQPELRAALKRARRPAAAAPVRVGAGGRAPAGGAAAARSADA